MTAQAWAQSLPVSFPQAQRDTGVVPGMTAVKNLPAGVLKPGKNRIVIRVQALDKAGFGGIFRNLFIYQKK